MVRPRRNEPSVVAQMQSLQREWRSLRGGPMGADRLAFQQRLAGFAPGMSNDYDLARPNRYRRTRTGVLTMGSSADFHVRIGYRLLAITEQARDMRRNDAAIGPIIDRAVQNTVGGGFMVKPKTSDPAVDRDLFDGFTDWSTDPDQCDLAQERSFHDYEVQLVDSTLTDGDMAVVAHDNDSLELVESHRIRTPLNTSLNVVHGVLLDDHRRRLQYWIAKDDINPLDVIKTVTSLTKYDVRDKNGNRQVMHVYNPKRVSQTRGVTALAPIADLGGIFQDLNFAKAVQAQAVSCFAFIEKSAMGSGKLPSVDQLLGARWNDVQGDGSVRTIEGTAPGMYVKSPEGKEITGFSPAVPNAEFFDHVKLILTLMGVNLGVPLCLLLLDGSETNFSGWRGAVDEARRGFRRNQRWLIERFHRPVYLWHVRRRLKQDPILLRAAGRLGPLIYRHKWQPPAWPYIDPRVDGASDLLLIKNGMFSPSHIATRNGFDFDDMLEEIASDHEKAIARAMEGVRRLVGKYPEQATTLSWRDIVPTPQQDGLSISQALMPGAEPPPTGLQKSKA